MSSGVDKLGQRLEGRVQQQMHFAFDLQRTHEALGLDQVAEPGQLNDQIPGRGGAAHIDLAGIHGPSSGKKRKKSRTPRISRPLAKRREETVMDGLDKQDRLC